LQTRFRLHRALRYRLRHTAIKWILREKQGRSKRGAARRLPQAVASYSRSSAPTQIDSGGIT
jgi:hypothetical protein